MSAPAATILLDSQGLALALQGDRRIAVLLKQADLDGATVHVSALTIAEAAHGRTDLRRLDWILSGFLVEGVRPTDGKEAVRLMRERGGLAGHSHAIDALVAVLASRLPLPVLVVTSDPEDWRRLAPQVRIIKV
ncbi:MAG: hypothetical protein LBK95_18545 [Bifidobacteriaceae bacterium]|nr:hypothetical protein [Bifidobacteriaceae bacterium]